MNKLLPSREQAIKLLQEANCSKKVISHCLAVSKLAVETAVKLEAKGYKVNVPLVEVGALLHDLGRSKVHTVDHAVIGAQIAKDAELPMEVISIIKRHVGGGITLQEAKAFGWPDDDYFPVTLEEKIVSYADKLIGSSRRIPIENTIRELELEHKPQAAQRVRNLYNEITNLLSE